MGRRIRTISIALGVAIAKSIAGIAAVSVVPGELMPVLMFPGTFLAGILEIFVPAVGDDRADHILTVFLCDLAGTWLLAFIIIDRLQRRPRNRGRSEGKEDTPDQGT